MRMTPLRMKNIQALPIQSMLGWSIFCHLGNVSGRLPSFCTPYFSIISSKITRVTNSAVNSEQAMPMSSVRPNPFTSSEPKA